MRGTRRGWKALLPLAALLACTLAGGHPAEARAPAAEPPQECPLTPAVDTTKYFGTRGGQPWALVDSFFTAAAVDFDDGVSDNSSVRLCDNPDSNCEPKKLWIQSEHRANCLQKADLAGQLRIFGRIRGRGTHPLPAYGFAADNADSTVYLLVRGSTVYALYRTPDSLTRYAPQPQGNAPGWRFFYDTTAHTHPGGELAGPAALWRDDSALVAMHRPAAGARMAGGPAAPGGDELATLQLTTLQYGWMVCASGCCQFQGTGDGPVGGPKGRRGPRGPQGPPPPPPGPPGPPPGPPPAPPRR